MKYIIIQLVFFLFSNPVKSQVISPSEKPPLLNENLKLTVEVKCIDSQFIVIPHLQILNKDSLIQIHKHLWINEREPADITFNLEKLVKCTNVNISTNTLRQPMYDPDFFSFITYKRGDSLNEHIDLEKYCPLTVGLYTIQLYLKYYVSGEEKILQSGFYNFDVPFEPKNSVWKNCKN